VGEDSRCLLDQCVVEHVSSLRGQEHAGHLGGAKGAALCAMGKGKVSLEHSTIRVSLLLLHAQPCICSGPPFGDVSVGFLCLLSAVCIFPPCPCPSCLDAHEYPGAAVCVRGLGSCEKSLRDVTGYGRTVLTGS
jgi:hypothetical protein